MDHSHEYSFPKDLESQGWFVDSGDLHHLTFNPSFLHYKKSYNGLSRVNVENGQSLHIICVGSFSVNSHSCTSFCMSLNDILLAPCITRSLLFVSKFSKDNRAVFDFYANNYFIKSKVSKVIILE